MDKKIKVSRKKLSQRESKRLERSRESLIRYNGELVEELLESEVYKDIIKPLLDESIASVDGKQINHKWLFGEFNKTINLTKLQFYSGYSIALKEFANRLISFIEAKNNLQIQKEEAKKEKHQPIINPFLEDLNEFNKAEEVWDS